MNPTSRQSGGLPAGFTTLRSPTGSKRAGNEQSKGPSREGRPFPFVRSEEATECPLWVENGHWLSAEGRILAGSGPSGRDHLDKEADSTTLGHRALVSDERLTIARTGTK